MRILDRYILIAFLVDFLVIALLIVGLITLGNAALNFDEFIEDKPSFWELVKRLARFCSAMPMVLFVSLAPVLTVAGAMLALSTFARTRELSAMRACGISPGRIALPLFSAAVVISLLMFACAELYLPARSADILAALSLGKGQKDTMLRQLCVDERGNVFYFESFSPKEAAAEGIWIETADGARIVATKARWHRDRLTLLDCEIYGAARGGADDERPTLHSHLAFETDLHPIDVEEPGARMEFQSLRDLKRLASTRSTQRHRLLLQIHQRIAHYLFSSWILLLIALPLSLGLGDRGRWAGLLVTAVVIAAFMLVHQSCTSLGERGQLSPVIAAWFPIALFGSIGVCMFSNSNG